MPLVERETAGEESRTLPSEAQFQVIGRFRPGVAGNVTGSIDAAQEQCVVIPPGEARAAIVVPGTPIGRTLRADLDTHFEDRPAEPGAKALAEGRQYLVLLSHQRSLGNDFTQGRAGGGRLDRAN